MSTNKVKIIYSAVITTILFTGVANSALDTTTKQTTLTHQSTLPVGSKNPLLPPSNATACRKEFGYDFYPQVIVTQVLKQHKFSQIITANINKDLEIQNTKVHDIVFARAQNIKPYLFATLKNPKVNKLYRDVALELFSATLKHQGISDPKQVVTLFDDIQYGRMKKFAECEGYEKYLKIKRGYMSVVRSLTPQEAKLEYPEVFH